MRRRFAQVDVFSRVPFWGNAVAVVLDAEGLRDEEMARIAMWTNLSETTFVFPPQHADADYLVRIFTPTAELPFAGHPTLGTAHAWLQGGGQSKVKHVVVQECAAGLITVSQASQLAFGAPPLVRAGAAGPELTSEIAAILDLSTNDLVAVEWVDNGPGWVAALLSDADAVLAVRPAMNELSLGVVGFHPPGSATAIEVRGFFPKNGALMEDPVTGSLNASVAQWLLGSGRIQAPYVSSQGTVIGRAGRVQITQDEGGGVWVGGDTVTCISGFLDL